MAKIKSIFKTKSQEKKLANLKEQFKSALINEKRKEKEYREAKRERITLERKFDYENRKLWLAKKKTLELKLKKEITEDKASELMLEMAKQNIIEDVKNDFVSKEKYVLLKELAKKQKKNSFNAHFKELEKSRLKEQELRKKEVQKWKKAK